MRIRKELIGVTIKVIDKPAVLIVDDPSLFPLYKNLGLDVFEKETKKRKKKDDSTDEGHNEQ